ncbi:MAG: LruC domain-containing protein [Salinivirgaceae bacterium]|nr:LruC domain-containing protein [Salinivirgaceae bacterium]
MKTSNILVILFLVLVLVSCKKFNIDDPADENSMANLNVPANFEWAVTKNLVINVSTSGVTDGSTLVLYDLDGNIIDKQRVLSSQAEFEVQIQNITDSLRLYSPETKMSKYFLSSQNNIIFGSGSLKNSSSRTADYALNFVGANEDYIEIDNSGLGGIVTSYPFTFSVWFKTDGPGPENYDMALISIADPNVSDNYYGIFLSKSGGKCIPGIRARDGSAKTNTKNMDLADDTWHQITGVFNSSNERILYVDGNWVKTGTAAVGFNSNAVILTLGRWGDSTPKSYFNGLMDNVCVWNKALTSTEVMNYYNNLPSGSETNLNGYWDFNEGSGTVVNNIANIYGGYPGNNTGAEYVLISDPIPDTDGDGVNDDDDDFPNDATKAYNTIYPSGSKYYYHLYEDLWPGLGDYDFNDIVLKTKLHTYKNAQNNLVGGRVLTSVYWIGGGLPRGAGMEWFESNGSATQLTYMPENTVTFTEINNVITDPVVNNAVQIFNNNIIESLNDSIDFEYTWDHNVGGNSLWVQVYIYNQRDHEVHMFGHPPTNAQDMSLFGTQHDDSETTWDWSSGYSFTNPADFYKTSTNLPWGLEIVTEEFRVPNEKTEIIDAYPQFKDWAESGGTINQDWYDYPDDTKTFLPSDL